ncbi:fructokinase [Edwardsiella piscicida]|uniref:fructokinase n=1 Tax=Edwardsiella piscicida TaxID=1263550 RepID=UPI0002C0CAE6|nr:fructokinase [Edwardsiella piscicida]AGH73152.1 ROK family Glucokinase [Edwardsiella piscicida C07-087]EKS7778837.1 fructokinase [Edwardsiella piscicida]EKS7782257.1 fructokinase [Edwardsiella piscicida]UCQ25423.1 fructokinase [Edwardsiella piscicida]UCQ35567.1 fructokinase [Edwardsiella piscicida]
MRIGIDLGGTKIEVQALGDRGETLFRRRVATPRHDYAATLAAIVQLVADAEAHCGERASVGVGIPGTLSPFSGRVKNANSTWLNGSTLDADLSALLKRTVRLANDANCLAVSEATDGAAAGARVVFAVIIGTGCGAGIALDGRVHAGGNGIAGEWGHNPLPWQDDAERAASAAQPCYCGKQGCIETFVSGSGFCADYRRHGGAALDGAQIMARADAGDASALAAIARYEQRLARSLAQTINTLDPDVIVLGGGMSNVSRLYRTLPDLITPWVFGGECRTPIRPAQHGDASGVRGAAWLWPA